jgi:hypothetical protein
MITWKVGAEVKVGEEKLDVVMTRSRVYVY